MVNFKMFQADLQDSPPVLVASTNMQPGHRLQHRIDVFQHVLQEHRHACLNGLFKDLKLGRWELRAVEIPLHTHRYIYIHSIIQLYTTRVYLISTSDKCSILNIHAGDGAEGGRLSSALASPFPNRKMGNYGELQIKRFPTT